MLTGIAGPDFSIAAKQETDHFGDEAAARLVAAELAEFVDENDTQALELVAAARLELEAAEQGDQVEGEQPEGDQVEAEQPAGDQAEGDQVEAEQPEAGRRRKSKK
jgi:hypothetical protein